MAYPATPASGSPSGISRRSLIGRSTALAGGVVLGRSAFFGPDKARAAALSGKIVVGFEDPDDLLSPSIARAAAALREANPEAEIEIQKAPGGNYTTQLFLSLTRGAGPDVFMLNGLGIGELAAAGLIELLDGFLSSWDGWAQYPEVTRNGLTYQDQVWALNWGMDISYLFYRKDLFAQAGLPEDWQPATPDDILAAAREVKAQLPDVMPYALYAGANGEAATASQGFLPLLYAYGGTMQDEAGKWIVDSCAIRQTLDYYQTAYQTDETVSQQVMTATSPVSEMPDKFGAGELAMIFEGSWAHGRWAADDAEAARATIGYALHPSANGDAPFTIGGVGNCIYIGAHAENKELAWEFVRLINTKEMHVAINQADPHIPARIDTATDPVFATTPFLSDLVAAGASAHVSPPDPSYRKLIGIVQNATGIVATGEVAPDEAVERYGSELTRVLGEENVVRQPCS